MCVCVCVFGDVSVGVLPYVYLRTGEAGRVADAVVLHVVAGW